MKLLLALLVACGSDNPPPTPIDAYAAARNKMVDDTIVARGIKDARVWGMGLGTNLARSRASDSWRQNRGSCACMEVSAGRTGSRERPNV